jgi:hypothetical protein
VRLNGAQSAGCIAVAERAKSKLDEPSLGKQRTLGRDQRGARRLGSSLDLGQLLTTSGRRSQSWHRSLRLLLRLRQRLGRSLTLAASKSLSRCLSRNGSRRTRLVRG